MGALGEVQCNRDDRPYSRDELAQALCEVEILCPTVTDTLDEALLSQAGRRTRLLANFGVGFNHIDMAAADALSIQVTNTPGVLTQATAEIALTLLLSVARRTGEGERLLRADRWHGWHPTHMLSTQVTGKTLGIVGMGRIGLDLARKAHHGLGMQILYNNRSPVSPAIEEELGARCLTLSALLEESDFVSLNCPATAETRHLIDQAALQRMPRHAFLINTARGDVVDETALIAALEQGHIAGAGLDVFAGEPDVPSALKQLENVVLLPHMGSGTRETRIAMGRCVVNNVRAYLNGEPLPDRVQAPRSE